MSSIFLSHTSSDKPFIEKLARDLKRLGVNVWFDKWEIQVGDSLTWKIEEGIRENEFLGIVLSQESLNSEWVKSELSAAWLKQMKTKKIVVLPIMYKDCDLPLFLADRKYADFRENYSIGLEELASVFEIKDIDTISINSWRRYIGKRQVDWKSYREKEFEILVTTLVDRAHEYNWSAWVGGSKNPYSITLTAYHTRDKESNISIKLTGSKYVASTNDEINPNNLLVSDYTIYVGNTVNECEEFIWRRMEDFKNLYGNPTKKPYYHTQKFLRNDEINQFAQDVYKKFNWYKGDPSK